MLLVHFSAECFLKYVLKYLDIELTIFSNEKNFNSLKLDLLGTPLQTLS